MHEEQHANVPYGIDARDGHWWWYGNIGIILKWIQAFVAWEIVLYYINVLLVKEFFLPTKLITKYEKSGAWYF